MPPNRLPAASSASKCTGLRSPVIAANSSMSSDRITRTRRATSPTFISGHLPLVQPAARIHECLCRPPPAVLGRPEKIDQFGCLGAVRGQGRELPVKDLFVAVDD